VSTDVQPADAVEATEEATEAHAAAEGIDASETSGAGSSSTLRDMLMSTEPNTPLERVESPFDPDAGGMNRVYRGFQKMLGADGLPAILDVGVGVAEFVVGRDFGNDESSEEGETAAPVGGESEGDR
jgi:hypothetical protein